MEQKLNLLLMGKAGAGKSATGNTLLNKQYFKTSADATSNSGEIVCRVDKFDNYTLTVVDGVCIENVGKRTFKDSSMSKALDTGIDAFLLVLTFGNRYAAEDKLAFDALKQTFGDSFLDHVIVVVTYGDIFETEMKEERRNIDFEEWCMEQTGDFRRLYDDCQGRFVLVNNREKNEVKKSAQIQALVKLAQDLHKNGPYTRLSFENAEKERQNVILKEKVLQKTRQVQGELDILKANIRLIQQGLMKCVLVGRAEEGKSATGNSLLNREVFEASNRTLLVTQEVDFNLTKSGNDLLMIVDTPGLDNMATRITEVKHMEAVLDICYGGIDVFLFVIKFGMRLTAENELVITTLKQIFGHSFLEHVVVIVTHGDNFQKEIGKDSYHVWFSTVKGELRKLYDDCQARFVLFNNKEKNEWKKQAKIQEVVKLAHSLRVTKGRYTKECFKNAENERKKLIEKSVVSDSHSSPNS